MISISFFGYDVSTSVVHFANKVCEEVKELQDAFGEISVIVMSDKEIQKINKEFLHHDCATDVIAFSYHSDPGWLPSVQMDDACAMPFGDIYISLETAKKESFLGAYPLESEVAFLILHGLLHLVGYDDKDQESKKKMFLYQEKIFMSLNTIKLPFNYQVV